MKRQMELSDETILVLGTLAYQEFTEAHHAVRTLEEREVTIILQGDGPMFFAEQKRRANDRLEAARRTKDELAPYFAEALARNLTPH